MREIHKIEIGKKKKKKKKWLNYLNIFFHFNAYNVNSLSPYTANINYPCIFD